MLKSILRFILKICYKVEVENFAKFNSERQLIIANHQSFIDGLLIGLFLRFKNTN